MGELGFGYLYDFRNPGPWRRAPEALYGEILDVVAETEALGFDGAWVPEHHLAGDGYMTSPLVALAAIAARTKRMRIGAGIALGPLYEPLRFAEDCAVLDTLCGGRLAMGLAIGYRAREYAAHGLDFTRRGARFDEFLSIVRRLWAGETVDFEGRHFSLEGARVSALSSRGQVPLYIGGFAPKAMERVARHGDGYFGNVDIWPLYRQKLEEQGKDPALAKIWLQELMLVVAHDKAAAVEELAPYFHHVSNTYAAWMAEDRAIGIEDAAMKPMDLDTFKRSGVLQVLTPAEAVDRFRALRDKAPVEHFTMMMPPGLPAERFLAYARTFADEVIPAFR
ncbi:MULTISPECIES: LLM class flavin-dependent oxidoreductase [Novosphingobium]|uniref:LLM class flavin-dependent oxidoreductase n=1 Tax=unclassified Novosphingobium TaxID=2644732 RepID=UPI0006C84BCF|nr:MULTISPECIES: LLM class flavin-dependent oxidoreductase [unclassified Novosphingobium]KPH59854.1 luciferase [Novosphingobium sp. ST904]MPS67159.1 LLM class flavin-dependent oxidoreductase [Novosphingobium sp.]TCM39817.1 alkanesulfonate monooxygenase SsuD/methylene tetrahydromethanopterin reductase-like flavin-dependent oxidoreductase (luciferase family) [Novosphingobium sp. ST904]